MPEQSEPRTAISYRRGDSSGWARSLYDKLSHTFGKDSVFIDFDGIGSGDDFERKIVATIQASDVLLALIGSRWLDATSDDGKRRLDDPHDTVLLEIRTGLDAALVIPVLVDGARMPTSYVLPAEIQQLSGRNAHVIGLKTFHRDVDDLVEEIRLQTRLLNEKRESISPDKRIEALEKELAQARTELEAARRGAQIRSSSRKPFDAFLVYSHRDAGRLAAVLQKALETYPPVGGRRLRIFRDTTDLAASPSLMSNIRKMVDNSEYLILLASPAAAQSHWVDQELSYFLQSRPRDRILMVLASGEPESSTPAILRSVLGADMPLFVDFRSLRDDVNSDRHPDFQMGVARLVAGIRGLDLDEVVDRRSRRQRQYKVSAIIALVLSLVLAALAVYWKLA